MTLFQLILDPLSLVTFGDITAPSQVSLQTVFNGVSESVLPLQIGQTELLVEIAVPVLRVEPVDGSLRRVVDGGREGRQHLRA